jgi:glycosyltransferase involved in cell wall biosynthesis
LKEQTELITTTEYAKQSLKGHLGVDLPIHVIYQSPKTLADRRDSGFLGQIQLRQKEYFLHLGTFDVRKNLPLLVRAYSDFSVQTGSDLKLVLAGGAGQSKQMNDFPVVQDLVSSLGLQDHVILPGYLSDSQVKALYGGAFGYVFPSENEGFGIPIIESMGYGVPVIHSDQAALMEVAGGAGLGFPTGDQQDLTKKMIQFLY